MLVIAMVTGAVPLPGVSMVAQATTTSTITVGGTAYTLFTGFTATSGNGTNYAKLVDGNTSTDWVATKNYGDPNAPAGDFNGGTEDPAFVEFHADEAFIPKGYVLTCDNENAGFWKPVSWALKAKLNEGDGWTTIHSSTTTLGEGKTFEIACDNGGDNEYQYFRFEVYEVGTTMTVDLDELQFYGLLPAYTHLTVKAATCMATGIKVDCYRRNSDGKYFTDNTGETELAESDVIAPIIPHTGEHHEATDVNIEYWQCSMCGKYFSDEGCTTEITEEQTKIYRTITIDNSISGLVEVAFSKTQALAGESIILYVDYQVDASTLKVNDGAVELTAKTDIQYTFTMPAADVTVTADVAQSNADGDILTGSIRHTVTIPNGASITLNNATITGGIVCNGTATITLVGTNSVSGATNKAGIQVGGSGTTLTICGDGSLTVTGGDQSAGIGLSRAWNVTEDVVGGNIVVNGGNITANGGGGGAGIGAGVTKDPNNSSSRKAIVGTITIAGGSVTAVGGSNADGIGAGENNYNATIQIGTVTIYDGTDKVDASSIKDFASVVYMHGETNVTTSKDTYFTISGNGDRRVIAPKAENPATVTGTVSVKKGNHTVDLSAYVALNGATGTVSYEISGEANGCTLNGSVLKSGSDAGSVTVNVTVAADDNYLASSNLTITVTVTKATQTISFADATIEKTYGDADFIVSVTGAKTAVSYEITRGDATTVESSTGTVHIVKAGTVVIKATAVESNDYASSTASCELTVNKATVTITAKDQSIYAGDAIPILGASAYTVVGLVGNDALATTPTLSYSEAPDNTKAGTYVISATGAAVPDTGNYDSEITYRTGPLTVKAKTGGGGTGGGGGSGGGGGTGGGGTIPPTPPTPDPGTENYTIPVTNETSVPVETKITDGNAVVSEITAKDIEKITGSASGEEEPIDTVTIDLSGAKQTVDSVELTKGTVEVLTKVLADNSNDISTVTIRMTDAIVELDASALEAIAKQSGGKTVKLSVDKGYEKSALNKKQQEAIGDYKEAVIFEACLESDGKKIHDLNGGTARVSVQYVLPEGLLPEGVQMLYLDPNGNVERLLTTYENGWASGILTHCSEYAIVYDESGTADDQGTVEMHRLYNPNSGEHFFTGNVGEKDFLITLGWSYEGVAWYAPESSSVPVYRLYNPNAGDHHYTMNKGERDILIELGWNDEGIGWYSSDAKAVSVFRLYNPNALSAGTHHFTANEGERDILVELGWNDEGIGWYGI